MNRQPQDFHIPDFPIMSQPVPIDVVTQIPPPAPNKTYDIFSTSSKPA